jgi:hypothetical protein
MKLFAALEARQKVETVAMDHWAEDKTRICRVCADFARQDPQTQLWGCRGCGIIPDPHAHFRVRHAATV